MNRNFKYVFIVLSIVVLAFTVSCAMDDTVEHGVGYIGFDGTGKGLVVSNEAMYGVDDLYWYYTAAWNEANTILPVDDITGITTDKVAVKPDEKGLGQIGPFLVGYWDFEIFGYTTTSDLTSPVYTATKTKFAVKKGITLSIAFQLENSDAFPEKGQLEFESGMTINVPENTTFTSGKTLSVEVSRYIGDTTETKLIAKSLTEITSDKNGGESVDLEDFKFEFTNADATTETDVNIYEEGAYKFQFKVYTSDTSTKELVGYFDHVFTFKKGIKTNVSNNLNDIIVMEKNFVNISGAAYSVGGMLFSDDEFDKAVEKAISSGTSLDVLKWNKLEDKTITDNLTVKLEKDSTGVTNVIVEKGAVLTIKLGDASTYTYTSGTIVEFEFGELGSGYNVHITGNGGVLTADAENDEVYLEGTFEDVDVVAVAMDSITIASGTKVDNLKIQKGHLIVKDYAEVGELNIPSTSDVKVDVESEAVLTTVTGDGASKAVKVVTLKANGVAGDDVTLYIVPNNVVKFSEEADFASGTDFKGWNTAADGKGTSYDDEFIFDEPGELTLYAQWRLKVEKGLWVLPEGVFDGATRALVYFDGNGKCKFIAEFQEDPSGLYRYFVDEGEYEYSSELTYTTTRTEEVFFGYYASVVASDKLGLSNNHQDENDDTSVFFSGDRFVLVGGDVDGKEVLKTTETCVFLSCVYDSLGVTRSDGDGTEYTINGLQAATIMFDDTGATYKWFIDDTELTGVTGRQINAEDTNVSSVVGNLANGEHMLKVEVTIDGQVITEEKPFTKY